MVGQQWAMAGQKKRGSKADIEDVRVGIERRAGCQVGSRGQQLRSAAGDGRVKIASRRPDDDAWVMP